MDERADTVADQLMDALGGAERWEKARFIRFTFVRRGRPLNIAWDRYTGRYRLEALNDAGVPFVVLMNLQTQQGRALLDGQPVPDTELKDYLDRATRMWTGETYWFLMPYKLRDPGVIMSYDGEETVGSTTHDRLHLRFENVGLTPGDQFWVYVNRRTHLVDRWKFKLQGGSEGDFRWTEWKRFGGLMLATERLGPTGERILFEDIVVSDTVPDDVFTLKGH